MEVTAHHNPSGTQCVVSVDSEETVASLKAKICRELRRPLEREVLRIAGTEQTLRDSDTIAGTGLESLGHIDLVRLGPDVHAPFTFPGTCHAMALSACGRFLALCTDTTTLTVWCTQAGERLWDADNTYDPAFTQGLAFSKCRVWLASTHFDVVNVWNVESGGLQCLLSGRVGLNGGVFAVCFTPGGYVVTGSGDATVEVWDVMTGESVQKMLGHKEWVTSVAASGAQVVSGASDRTVRLWSLRGEEAQILVGHESAVLSVAITTCGKTAVSCSRSSLRLWDMRTGAPSRVIPGDDMSYIVLSDLYIAVRFRSSVPAFWAIAGGRERPAVVDDAGVLQEDVEAIAIGPCGDVLYQCCGGVVTVRIIEVEEEG